MTPLNRHAVNGAPNPHCVPNPKTALQFQAAASVEERNIRMYSEGKTANRDRLNDAIKRRDEYLKIAKEIQGART